MVALSPRSMKELGAPIAPEDADKAFHEVSGRKGLGVKADDLLDRLEEKAFAEVDRRNADLSLETKKRTAREIARRADEKFPGISVLQTHRPFVLGFLRRDATGESHDASQGQQQGNFCFHAQNYACGSVPVKPEPAIRMQPSLLCHHRSGG